MLKALNLVPFGAVPNASKLSAKPLNKMLFICIAPLFGKEGLGEI